MIVTLSLALPGEAASVRVARRMLASTLELFGVPNDTAFDMCLALTEACTNVVDHSHAEAGYEVVVEVGEETCRMTVTDTGQGFQPTLFGGQLDSGIDNGKPDDGKEARAGSGETEGADAGRADEEPDDEESDEGGPDGGELAGGEPDGGRGIPLIQALTDRFGISSGPGEGVIVFLERRLYPAGRSSATNGHDTGSAAAARHRG